MRIPTALLLLPLSLAGAACSTSSKQSANLRNVDELLGQVERVHAESVLARDRARGAHEALRTLVSADFQGDPVEAYARFVESVELSKRQTEALRGSVAPMRSTAELVFARWAKDLEAFQNAELRRRSQGRLADTRRRYEAIVAAVEPYSWSCEAFNNTLADHALFLGHDFNSSAIAEIGDAIGSLDGQLAEIDRGFESCDASAREYVRSSALLGQVETTTTEAAPPLPEKR
jgi:hypothetical protein